MNQPADAASAAWVQESAFLMIRLNFNYFQSEAPDMLARTFPRAAYLCPYTS